MSMTLINIHRGIDIGSTDTEAASVFVQRGSRYRYGSRYPYKGGLGNRTSTESSTNTEDVSVSVQEWVSVSVL